jgi:hypothetical protein
MTLIHLAINNHYLNSYMNTNYSFFVTIDFYPPEVERC